MILLASPIRMSLVPAYAEPLPTRPTRHMAQRALRRFTMHFVAPSLSAPFTVGAALIAGTPYRAQAAQPRDHLGS